MDHTIFTASPSAGGSIRRLIRSQGTRPRYVVDCRDNLSVGPLLPLDNLSRFAKARSRFWRTHKTPVSATGWLASVNGFRTTIKARPIEVWVGSTVQEQCALLAFLALVRGMKLPQGHIRLLQFPLNQTRIGLGGYRPEDMAGHPPAEVPDTATLASYQQAWEALIASTPHALFTLAQNGTSAPALNRALKAFILRYPEQKSGLGSIERGLLANMNLGQMKCALIVAKSMYTGGLVMDSTDDHFMFARLKALGHLALAHPLVEIFGIGKNMRRTEARITAFGKACLAGEASHLWLREGDKPA